MTIITEETIEETMDADEKTISETVKDAGGRILAETVKDAGGRTVASAVENACEGTVAETIEEIIGETIGETIEEVMEETMEEPPGQMKGTIAPKTRPGHRFRLEMRNLGRKKVPGMKVQGEQWKRVAGWLAPYVAALLLIMLTGGAILLATSVKTDYLSKQIQKQYGEYFTDGQ